MPNDGGATWTSYGKAFGSSNSWRTKLWSSITLCQSRSKYARKEQRREEKQSEENRGQQLHFWSTYRNPFSTFYIPFQSSGSQESNASSGVWFGVETKKLQPLQVNHSKVLRNHPFVAKWFRSLFVQCCGFPPKVAQYMPQAGSWEPQGGSQLRSPATFCVSAKSRRHHFLLRNGP